MLDSLHILIIGGGSVGKRHARNLHIAGCKISCIDPRADRRNEIEKELPVESVYANLEQILEPGKFHGVVVASPTAFHKEHALWSIKAGLPTLLEKPAAMTLSQAIEIKEATKQYNVPVLLGYSWRWWPPLQKVKKLLEDKKIGELRHVQFHMSAHLADWHPWEPYQSFFMSKKELGGGALLDESHWIDLMIWILGSPESVRGTVSKLSNLEIETDDNVDIICTYPGANVTIHLDLFGRPHEKFIRFVGDSGTIVWSASPNRIAYNDQWDKEWQVEDFTYERNDMFMATASEFMAIINGRSFGTCTIDDGVLVMDVIEAVRESSTMGNTIHIKDLRGSL
jgi:predicted dehydrogenase